ncbi:hypothetical protein PSWA111526_25415 [Pseudomonas wadenswilerensis]|uniref:Uncharacterized protein n=1 Tax=Pseudomonas wadenswilerensis TaxID=1785161 RepID=A0A380T3V6_9PSED|nr:hypothetical protein CCOS864_03646 [Pseudomonas wadenswilerensis]
MLSGIAPDFVRKVSARRSGCVESRLVRQPGRNDHFTTRKVERDSDRSSSVFALPDRRSAIFRTNPNHVAFRNGSIHRSGRWPGAPGSAQIRCRSGIQLPISQGTRNDHAAGHFLLDLLLGPPDKHQPLASAAPLRRATRCIRVRPTLTQSAKPLTEGRCGIDIADGGLNIAPSHVGHQISRRPLISARPSCKSTPQGMTGIALTCQPTTQHHLP